MLTKDFHPAQITYVLESRRTAKYANVATFICGISACVVCVLPSHWSLKISNIAIASGLFITSYKLEKLQKWSDDYQHSTNHESIKGYAQHLNTSFAPPRREIAIAQPEIVESPSFYDWQNISDEAVGFLICGNSGSAKSSLATWLAGHLSQSNPMAVIALDPHFNDCWKLAGIQSIGKIEQIEAALNWLLSELDARCDRKGEGLPLGDHLFVICDELNASLERFKDRKIVESTLRRLGSEGRKFGLTFCGLNQSSNAGAIGIDAKYRSNYALILLGQSARTHPQLGKHLVDVAYPCLLDGSCAPCLAKHPTHGDYSTFKKSGNPPKNLMQINQLALPSGLLAVIDSPHQLPIALPSSAITAQSQSTAIAPIFTKIINYLDGRDWTRDNVIKQSITDFKNADTPIEEIQGYLQFLEVQGHLETRGAGRNGLEAKKI